METSEHEPWEYRVVVFKVPDVSEGQGHGEAGSVVQDSLKRLGADDWELAATLSTVKTWVNLTGNALVFVFKRRGMGKWEERPEDRPGYVVY